MLLRYLKSYIWNSVAELRLSKKLQDSLENIIAIDSKSLQEKSKIRIRSNYNYLSCSHDDKYLAVGYHFNICVYDLEAGRKIKTLYLGNSLADSILVNYNPIYLDRFLDVGNDKSSHPNILTAFFRPEKKYRKGTSVGLYTR